MVSGVVEDNRAKTDSHIDRNKTFLTFVKTRPCLSPRRMEVCFGRAENALRSISERLQQILVLLFHLAQKVIKQLSPQVFPLEPPELLRSSSRPDSWSAVVVIESKIIAAPRSAHLEWFLMVFTGSETLGHETWGGESWSGWSATHEITCN